MNDINNSINSNLLEGVYDGKRYIAVKNADYILFLSGKDESVIGTFGGILCGIQLIFLIGSLFPTEIALKKNFDEHGNRKKL